MSPVARRQFCQELDVIERFASSASREFASLISELNGNPTPEAVARALRLCVEAVHMLLETQKRLAVTMRAMGES